MPATMTILGLYDYDMHIFDNFNVPQGMDKATSINKILLDCYELEILYPNPNILKILIGHWSDVNQDIWSKLYATEHFDYNPIWNVDADITEKGTAYKNRAGNNSTTGSGSETESGTDYRNKAGNNTEETSGSGTDFRNKAGNNTETGTDDSTSTNSVKGFNSDTWAEHEKTVIDDDTTKTGTYAEGETGGNTQNENKSGTFAEGETGGDSRTRTISDGKSGNFSEDESGGDDRTIRRTGNIGVTTTQQMIREEREIDNFSTYQFIADSFKRQFCLMVY